MAYQVDFTIPSRTLGRADVTFVVKTRGKVVGTLEVSKGALVWYPMSAVESKPASAGRFKTSHS